MWYNLQSTDIPSIMSILTVSISVPFGGKDIERILIYFPISIEGGIQKRNGRSALPVLTPSRTYFGKARFETRKQVWRCRRRAAIFFRSSRRRQRSEPIVGVVHKDIEARNFYSGVQRSFWRYMEYENAG